MKSHSAPFVSSIGLVFPFNEVNAGVFQNAGLWAAKKNFGVDTTIYSPNHFKGLYFAADKVIEVNPLPYSTYREVAEFEPNSISRKKLNTYFTKGTINYLHHLLLEKFPADIYHALPISLRSDYKTRKYLVKSGIFELTKRHYYSHNSQTDAIFLGDGLYYNLAKFQKNKKNLNKYFEYSFQNLYDMIKSGRLNSNHTKPENSLHVLIQEPLKFLRDFNATYPKIFLRTRNINSSVSFQNAPALELTELIQELLNQGFVVINSGVPVMKLDIKNRNYLEFNNNLPISDEMILANCCDYVMQTAWAGLFTAYASFNKPLITFDNEWSLTNLKKPISLLEARKIIGIEKDIDISTTFSRDKYLIRESVRKITSSL